MLVLPLVCFWEQKHSPHIQGQLICVLMEAQ